MYPLINKRPGARATQRGSALIVGLILLLVVTILAIAGMQDTLLQERMSGHWHDRNLAFQASEAALRQGEGWLESSTANHGTAQTHDRLEKPFSWDGDPAHGTLDMNDLDLELAEDAAYYVNPPSYSRVPGSMDIAEPECDRIFPIFGHGVGGTENARVTLRADIIPRNSPLVSCPPELGE
ncbi:PilX N-terminal domain-containing pilus assembly protein [Thioalkalivibrio sp. ALJ24]|uniref:pilus assembly PilX family protein n=1 Tax=Thioalkalivibrio sp. ALJ24 TaxID=545276 RepID=UPI00036D9208